MKRLFIVLTMLAAGGAGAQTEAKLEACNRIANSAQRMVCLTEAIKPAPVVVPVVRPLNAETAAPICDAILTRLAPKRLLATEDVELSTAEEISVMWPAEPGKTPTYCNVNRATRKVVSLTANGKVISGPMLAEFEKKTILAGEIANGNYVQFVATAKSTLVNSFKDPSSAQYRDLFVSTSSANVLCGEVNAKNSYGAYIGYRRFYATDLSALTSIEDAKENYVFRQMWPSMCGERRASVE